LGVLNVHGFLEEVAFHFENLKFPQINKICEMHEIFCKVAQIVE
jgi:hypothetical protein